ncbi:MAG: tRNA (5-methylaminomethyl-2-thiouridine)(34)-methyltransferase MnmD [Bacteroidetes bacterium]|nr:tRNA (5-methylaminomethyl-2-thiouridine)(34)-methyltransferase MnmD [Bacteroidota bacterium]
MQREIITTADGSTTIRLPDWDEHYHSKHGAIQEAQHVFIKNGLALFADQSVDILEIGFGTGLNALITYKVAPNYSLTVNYVGIEAYPIHESEVLAMNYASELKIDDAVFAQMHQCSWNESHSITDDFNLTKRQQFFSEISDEAVFDLIYFDAFGYRVQPELWSEEIFKIMFRALKPGGILVTYAARSIIKKNMIASGFTVSKLPGPPGKREMFRAIKAS